MWRQGAGLRVGFSVESFFVLSSERVATTRDKGYVCKEKVAIGIIRLKKE